MKATEWAFGMSSCSTGKVDIDTFEQYAKHGVEMIETSFGSLDAVPHNWKELETNSRDTGVKLWSVHLPFWPFDVLDFASFDKEARKKALAIQCEITKNAADIGIKTAVIHPSGEPYPQNERDERIKIAADMLAQLAEAAHSCGVTVAVEDLPRTCLGNCSADIKRLIADNQKLRVCFDTNHLLSERNVDFVKALGDKIVTLHVSDYDFRNERHWLPYEGSVDWAELVTALEDVGYCGPFMYEISLKTPASIKRRDLTFADFSENYKACVEKCHANVIGTPDMEECLKNSYYKEPII